MKLCSGQCKYLLTVYELSKTNKIIRAVDIANKLSVSRPSVSRMLKCMTRLELILPDTSISIKLTELGIETAKKLSVNYDVIYNFFNGLLNLSEKEAAEQALLFIATFPETTVEKLSQITVNTFKKRNQK